MQSSRLLAMSRVLYLIVNLTVNTIRGPSITSYQLVPLRRILQEDTCEYAKNVKDLIAAGFVKADNLRSRTSISLLMFFMPVLWTVPHLHSEGLNLPPNGRTRP